MKKSEINSILKECGLGFVKAKVNNHQSKTLTNFEGKKFKGIRGGSIGPMTMTDAYIKHNIDKEIEIINKIGHGFVKKHIPNVSVEFDINGTPLKLIWSTFPTYAHNEYDASYKNFWMVIA